MVTYHWGGIKSKGRELEKLLFSSQTRLEQVEADLKAHCSNLGEGGLSFHPTIEDVFLTESGIHCRLTLEVKEDGEHLKAFHAHAHGIPRDEFTKERCAKLIEDAYLEQARIWWTIFNIYPYPGGLGVDE